MVVKMSKVVRLKVVEDMVNMMFEEDEDA